MNTPQEEAERMAREMLIDHLNVNIRGLMGDFAIDGFVKGVGRNLADLLADRDELVEMKKQLKVFKSSDMADDVVGLCNTNSDLEKELERLNAENELLRTVAKAVENRQAILKEYGCWGILEALANLAAKGVKL
jgi:hypothetical protein